MQVGYVGAIITFFGKIEVAETSTWYHKVAIGQPYLFLYAVFFCKTWCLATVHTLQKDDKQKKNKLIQPCSIRQALVRSAKNLVRVQIGICDISPKGATSVGLLHTKKGWTWERLQYFEIAREIILLHKTHNSDRRHQVRAKRSRPN